MSRFFGDGGVRVKICGVTRPSDAEAVVAAGADAIGFNFWAGSKRHVLLERVSEWAAELPITRVAVVVDASEAELRQLADSGLFEAIQFHGHENPETCLRAGFPVWIKATQAESEAKLEALEAYPTPHVLIDAHVPGKLGGTGVGADRALVAEYVVRHPERRVILAGGLRPDNVAEACAATAATAVDTAGGVEASPGIKDAAMIRDFVAAAKGK